MEMITVEKMREYYMNTQAAAVSKTVVEGVDCRERVHTFHLGSGDWVKFTITYQKVVMGDYTAYRYI